MFKRVLGLLGNRVMVVWVFYVCKLRDRDGVYCIG